MTKETPPVFAQQAELTLSRAIYPTAWGCGGAPYTHRSALEHTRAALRALARAGYQVCRNRRGAGHAAPAVAPLLAALEDIRALPADAPITQAKKIADKALGYEP